MSSRSYCLTAVSGRISIEKGYRAIRTILRSISGKRVDGLDAGKTAHALSRICGIVICSTRPDHWETLPACEKCGDDSDLIHTCSHCGGKFCRDHHLPENHKCTWVMALKTLGPDFRNLRSRTADTATIGSSPSESTPTGSGATARGQPSQTKTATKPSRTHESKRSSTVRVSEWLPTRDQLKSLYRRTIRYGTVGYGYLVTFLLSPITVTSKAIDFTWENKRELIVLLVVLSLLITYSPASATWLLPSEYGNPIDHTVESTTTGIVSAGTSILNATTANSTGSPDDAGSPSAGSEQISPGDVERLVLEHVNDRRSQRSMSPLDWHERAANAARTHAQDMAANNYFSHTSQDGQTQRERYAFCAGGENAAQTWVYRQVRADDGETEYYTSTEELAQGIVEQWMGSEPHRERGIYGGRWTAAGVGIAISDDDKVYAVMGFCTS